MEDANENFAYFTKVVQGVCGERIKIMSMKDEDWEELDFEAQTTIILFLERDVAFLVNEKATTAGDDQS